MRRLSSEGPVTSGEQYGRTCQRPNTERGYQHPVKMGVPPMGGEANLEGKLGQGAQGDCSIPAYTKAKKVEITLHQALTPVPSPVLSTVSLPFNNFL